MWRRFVSSNATSFSVTTRTILAAAPCCEARSETAWASRSNSSRERESCRSLPAVRQTQPRYSRNSYVRCTSSTDSVYGISSNTLQSKLDSAPTISEERSNM